MTAPGTPATRLYRVTVTRETEIVVIADDATHAEAVAREAVGNRDFDDWHGIDFSVRKTPVSSTKDLPRHWDRRCLPWGETEDREIGDILDADRPVRP